MHLTLWRARRRRDHIEAILRRVGPSFELQYLRNDRVLLVWQYPDEQEAVADAHTRLRDLQRAGWSEHW